MVLILSCEAFKWLKYVHKVLLNRVGAGLRSTVSSPCLTREPEVPSLIYGPPTYFHFSFCWFKKGSCQLLAKVCARSTG